MSKVLTVTNNATGVTQYLPVDDSIVCGNRSTLYSGNSTQAILTDAQKAALLSSLPTGQAFTALNCDLLIYEFYVARNAGGTLSIYADGTGAMTATLVAVGGTPAYSPASKPMLTESGGYTRAGLFTGSKPYGALFFSVPNGSYIATLVDANANTKSLSFTLTDTQPVVKVYPTGSTSSSSSSSSSTSTSSSSSTVAPGTMFPPHTLSGDTSGGYPPNEPTMISMTYTISGGRITAMHNTVTPSLSGSQQIRYLLNNIWFAFVSGQWYQVIDNTGTLASSATALSYNPEFGVLVQLFLIDPSKTVDMWRDNPTPNASQLVRAL